MSFDVSQLTSCCSERERSFPVRMALMPSIDPVVENAQPVKEREKILKLKNSH
jgi:hypothetical protein